MVSTSISVCTLIQPRLGQTFHFSRIHSPRFVTWIPVLSAATMISSVRSPGTTGNERSRRWIRGEKGGIIGYPERGDECRESPNKSLHLAVGHLQEDVDAVHPRNASGY